MKVFATDNSFLSNIQNKAQYQLGDPRIICKILSDSLYSNKIGSIIRELSANAYDAHKDNGKIDVPFDVHCPTNKLGLFNNDEKYFSIRDYGKGLTEEQILSIYTVYGGSTKRDTNAFIGGFGIGCKSPFAYTRQFEVTSYCEGRKKLYLCYIDENEYPCVSKISDKETEEPSGLEVTIHVDNLNDADTFNYECIRQYAYYDVVPNCNINIPKMESFIETEKFALYVKLHNEKALEECFRNYTNTAYFYHKNSYINFCNYNSNIYIKMNNTVYTVPTEIYKNINAMWNISDILCSGVLILKADIGSCDINASREDIAVTSKSEKTITQLYHDFVFSFIKELVKKFEGMSDYGIYRELNSRCLAFYTGRNHTPAYNLSLKEERVFNIMCYGVKFDVKRAINYLNDHKIRFYGIEKTLKNGIQFKQGFSNKSHYLDTCAKNATIGVDSIFISTLADSFIKLYFINKNITNKTARTYFEELNLDSSGKYHLFFINDKSEADEIISWYSGAPYVFIDDIANPKRESKKNKISNGFIQYYVFKSSALKQDYRYFVSNLRYNIRYSTIKQNLDYNEFSEFIKNNKTLIIVLDNCEMVNSDKLKKDFDLQYCNLDYQYALCNFLNMAQVSYHLSNTEYNIVMFNVENYRKYVNNMEKYNFPKLNDVYAKKMSMQIIKDYIPIKFNCDIENLLSIYVDYTEICNALLSTIPNNYLFYRSKDNKFFETLYIMQQIIGNVYYINDTNAMRQLVKIFDIKYNQKNTQWFEDYINKYPILKLLSDRNIILRNLKYQIKEEYLQNIIEVLDKYLPA